MPRQNDISSTERLLNVIRSSDSVEKSPVQQAITPKRPRTLTSFKILGKSTLSVGVDITDRAIHMVMVEHRNRKKPSVLDCRSVDLPPDSAGSRKRKIEVLGRALADFCPASPPPRLWTTTALEETDSRLLRIPRVPHAKQENTIYWTCQKEAPFEKEKTLLDFRVLGHTVEKDIPKTEVLVCTAARGHVEKIQALFRNAGFELSGIIAPPLIFQNYIKSGWCHAGDALAVNLLVDFNWSRIDIVRSNGDLVVSRGIKAGIASMIESIRNEGPCAPEMSEMPDDPADAPTVLELSVSDTFDAEQVLQILNTDIPAEAFNAGKILNEADVFDMVLPALERLVRQVERTLEHVRLRYSGSRIARLFFSGPITAYPRILTYMAGQLDLPAETVNPFASTPPDVKIPETVSARSQYMESAGLALSDTAPPPNFLNTYREKRFQRRTRWIRCAILFGFLIAAGLIGGHHLSAKRHIRSLEKTLGQLNETREASKTFGDGTSLLAAVSKANQKNRHLKELSNKYFPVALIGEVTGLAPEEIRFFSIEGRTSDAQSGDAGEVVSGMTTMVDGAIYGSPATVETTLARYLLLLKNSPLIDEVSLEEKLFQQINSKQVLRFFLSLEGA